MRLFCIFLSIIISLMLNVPIARAVQDSAEVEAKHITNVRERMFVMQESLLAVKKAIRINDFERAVQLATEAMTDSSYLPSKLYEMRGKAYYGLGQYEKAEVDFKAAIHRDKSSGVTLARYMTNLHDTYIAWGKIDAANSVKESIDIYLNELASFQKNLLAFYEKQKDGVQTKSFFAALDEKIEIAKRRIQNIERYESLLRFNETLQAVRTSQ